MTVSLEIVTSSCVPAWADVMGVLWTMLGVDFERRFEAFSADFERPVAAVWLLVAFRGVLESDCLFIGVNDAIATVDAWFPVQRCIALRATFHLVGEKL
jgi:hypothetical protein